MPFYKKWGLSAPLWSRAEDAIAAGLTVARVTEVQRNLFQLDGEYAARPQQWWADLAGRLRHEADAAEALPTLGDWVIASGGGPYDRLQILEILPRTSLLGRKTVGRSEGAQLFAANVDHLFVVSSCNQDLNLRRLERYQLLAEQAQVPATVLLSKADLLSDRSSLQLSDVEKLFPYILISSVSGEGFEALSRLLIPGQTVMFLGSSGVGKSSLINALMGEQRQAVLAIREGDDKGRHATSFRSLFALPNACLVMDMPGIRELALTGLDVETLDASFSDIQAFAEQCQFRDCSHAGEPGCMIASAIADGHLDPARLKSYRKLQREQASSERRSDARKASEERKKWKSISKQMKRHPKKDRFR